MQFLSLTLELYVPFADSTDTRTRVHSIDHRVPYINSYTLHFNFHGSWAFLHFAIQRTTPYLWFQCMRFSCYTSMPFHFAQDGIILPVCWNILQELVMNTVLLLWRHIVCKLYVHVLSFLIFWLVPIMISRCLKPPVWNVLLPVCSGYEVLHEIHVLPSGYCIMHVGL